MEQGTRARYQRVHLHRTSMQVSHDPKSMYAKAGQGIANVSTVQGILGIVRVGARQEERT